MEAGRLANLILLKRDPLANIRVLQGGQHLVMVIMDGRIVDLDGHEETAGMVAFAPAAAQVYSSLGAHVTQSNWTK